MKAVCILLMLVCTLLLAGCIQDRIKPYSLGERTKGQTLVTLRIRADSARSIYLAGSFNDWTIPRYEGEINEHPILRPYKMEKRGNYWSVVIPMDPGLHYYKYYVDFSYWMIDESSHEKTQTISGDWRNILVVK